jgi:hypothetical protein
VRAVVTRPQVILALGWVVFLLYAYPGVMTMDSFDQLKEGRAWYFTDSHPPVMAAIWGIVDRFLAGPFGMLVIQSACFLSGLYLILCRAMSRPRAALVAVGLFLFPPVLVPMAVIWKDCLMAGFLVLGIAAMFDDRRWVRLVGLGAFCLATAFRYNALAATLPLVVLLFEWERGQRWLARYAIAAGVWLAITAVALGGNALLTDRKMHFWHSSLALADIVGVLAFVDEDLPDGELRPLLAPTGIRADTGIHAAVRAQYKSYDFQQLLTGDGRLWDVPWVDPLPEPRRDAISHAWLALIEAHPSAFLRYRLDNFGETLGIHRKFQGAMVVTHAAQYPGMLDYMGVGKGSSGFQEIAEAFTKWCARHTRLFRPHFYALLSLLLLGLCRRQRDVLAIVLSGLSMELTMLGLGATPDYRYSHWLVVATCLAIVMLVARRYHDGDIARRNV